MLEQRRPARRRVRVSLVVGQDARRFEVGDEDLGAQTVWGDEGGGGVRFVLGLGEQVLRV